MSVACESCGKRLHQGDPAMLVPIRQIVIRGGVVTKIDRDAIYCEACGEAA